MREKFVCVSHVHGKEASGKRETIGTRTSLVLSLAVLMMIDDHLHLNRLGALRSIAGFRFQLSIRVFDALGSMNAIHTFVLCKYAPILTM